MDKPPRLPIETQWGRSPGLTTQELGRIGRDLYQNQYIKVYEQKLGQLSMLPIPYAKKLVIKDPVEDGWEYK